MPSSTKAPAKGCERTHNRLIRVDPTRCARVQGMSSPRSLRVAGMLAFASLLLTACPQAQQTVAPDEGCALQRGEYHCDWSQLRLAFDRAHTVAVRTDPMDRATLRQLHTLVDQLGKTPAMPDQSPDLTFMLVPVEPTGVNLGPGDHDLATLRVYAPVAGSERGALLWVETLRGQGDRPWPAQAHLLIEQFQARFHQS